MDVKMDQFILDKELAHMEAVSAAYAQHFIPDAKVRLEYIEQTKKFSSELLAKCSKGELSPHRAAFQAQAMRNTIMEAQRVKSTPLGLSIAKFIKKEGKTLSQLEEKYANEIFKKEFSKLTENQRNDVWRHIVQKAGAPQVSASNGAKWMGRAGRGLFVCK